MSARSLLYVPGNKPPMFDKAVASGADAIILDLEDAVAHDQKDAARDAVVAWLATAKAVECEIWVRLNAGALMARDVVAICAAASPGIVAGLYLPKASSVSEVEELDALLPAGLNVTALIETAAGVFDARALAAHPRVTRLAIGEADLGSELGVRPSHDAHEMLPMRMTVVLASAAAGIDSPVGSVSTDFKDLDALRASSEALANMGFTARAAIHPAQVQVINQAFTPSTQEIASAQRLLELFEQAAGGVCVDDSGRMVDEAIVKAARGTLARSVRGT